MNTSIPTSQSAVQLTRSNELRLNTSKPVPTPGPFQLLCRVEAVGLCFSDMKLLHQFDTHVRKAEVVSGIDTQLLTSLPGYVPGSAPTVPGHEAVIRVVQVGEQVRRFRPGPRYLVQADWRWLRTPKSNAAFGYNFEGALQEYVLLDERVITSPEGEPMLLPVSERKSASALALVEPWACVEQAYAASQRQTLQPGGRLLVVADVVLPASAWTGLLERYGRPAHITWLSASPAPNIPGIAIETATDLSTLPDNHFDDIVYTGASAATADVLFSKMASGGLLNLVLCGGRFRQPITVPVGRIHYEGLRIVGTPGNDPAESMVRIPATGELRSGDALHIVGAGGPMGVMHVVRCLCQGVDELSVFASDVSELRLEALRQIAEPMAQQRGLALRLFNPQKESIDNAYDYIALMAPIPALVAQAVQQAAQHATINIFAGIPVHITGALDLDAYVEKGLYAMGTSGSTLDDMRAVLRKVESGDLDTNVSVAAISGLDGAIDGLRAVENNAIPGKILIYPACQGLGLTPLPELKARLPRVARKLRNGMWTLDAERALQEICAEEPRKQ